MNKQTRLSIIVPVYNVEKYLPGCLDSILKQEAADLEIILVDDGSTDHSGSICDEYARKDDRIQVIHQPNGGVSAARNAGLARISGRWVTFIDADDRISDHYYDTICAAMGDCDLAVFSSVIEITDAGRTLNHTLKDVVFSDRESIEQEVLKLKSCKELDYWDFYGYPWNKVFKTEIIRKYGISFPEKVKFREDDVFTTTYLRYVRSLRLIAATLYFYELKSTGLTNARLTSGDYYAFASAMRPVVLTIIHKDLLSHELNKIFYYYWNSIKLCRNAGRGREIVQEACAYFKQVYRKDLSLRRKYRKYFGQPSFLSNLLIGVKLFYHRCLPSKGH